MDDGLLRIQGAQEIQPDKYVSLAFIKLIGGLQTQRSPFQSLDNRYNTKFLGGKPDALLDGKNVEISNKLTLQRRPGLSVYGPSIDSPRAFFPWEISTTQDINIMVDTKPGINSVYGQILRYSSTHSGVYVNKSGGSSQANFITVSDTLYMGDGVDLFKIIGPNLLLQSNTFGTGITVQSPWTGTGITDMTPRQVDPNNGTTATEIQWSTTGPGASLIQQVVPNYTPIAKNTFTFSVWMKINSGSQTMETRIADQNGSISSDTFTLTTAWQKCQITGTMGSASSQINVAITNPSTSTPIVIYGTQLEVGGPATTTQVTTTRAQGVYLWGIKGPSVAPTLSYADAAGKSANFPNRWAPDTLYTANTSIIIDSNGDLELCTATGTSGTTEPTWATLGGVTTDGISNSIVQESQNFAQASTVSAVLSSSVTHNNTLFAFIMSDVPSSSPTISVTDTQSNSWTQVAHVNAGDNNLYLYAVVASAAAGSTTVTATLSSPTAYGVWLCVAEVQGLTVFEVENTNSGRNVVGGTFNTGVVTTTADSSLLITFAASENNAGSGTNLMGSPSGYQILGTQSAISTRSNARWLSITAACTFLSTRQTINPIWSISGNNTTSGAQAVFQTITGTANGVTGITAAYTTAVSTLQWTNVGNIYTLNGVMYNSGLTPTIGYTYYFAFMNSQTGHVSNVSVTSGSTGAADTSTNTLVAQIISVSGIGMQTSNSGDYDHDPQVDTIVVFRNTDGGGDFYQIATFSNPGDSSSAGTWILQDVAPDNGISVPTTVTLNGVDSSITEALNTSIFAPIDLLNSVPPAGLIDFDFFAGRIFGSSGSFVYYNTAEDNAALLGIDTNGVAAESWAPANEIPFNAKVTRLAAVGGGLFTCTVLDSWFVTGVNLLNGGFNPGKILINHGLRSYNALSLDGSSIYMYTADRQFLCVNANSGSIEFGFAVGDVLETIDPTTAYVIRHVAGSTDNAVYISDGQSLWYRLNPNQQGASMSGEQTPVWSPKADFSVTLDGISAIGSMQVSPGVIKLFVGQANNGPVLVRDLSVFSDDGVNYSWFAQFGSILLTTPGKLAETESVTVELNNNTGATVCSVSVLLEEIDGVFEDLPNSVDDPPQLQASTTVLSNRYYLSQGETPPVCRHMQVKLTGGTVDGAEQSTKDELLGLTIRGCLVSEQV